MPVPIAAIAFQNKGAVYAILFKTAVEALTTLAARAESVQVVSYPQALK